MPNDQAQERLAAGLAEKLSQDLPTGDSPGDLATEAEQLAEAGSERVAAGDLRAAVACAARAGNIARAVANAEARDDGAVVRALAATIRVAAVVKRAYL